MRRLFPGGGAGWDGLTLSRDARRILFTYRKAIYSTSESGGRPAKMIDAGVPAHPAWRP
jgi:hypothetical protein